MQRYRCQRCGKRFSSSRRHHIVFQKQLWEQYVFHKHTVSELAERHHHDPRTILDLLATYVSPLKIHHPRPTHVIVDATYFGERKEGSSWCVIVVRDALTHENLVWRFAESETTSDYRVLRDEMEALGYTIQSVTGDGFGGIKTAFYGIPYQMCQVHMERLVTMRTTRKPQTEAGQVLLALAKSLHTTTSHVFHVRLQQYVQRYHEVLIAKTYNPLSGRWDWTHRPLRQAVTSLERLRPYLFTYEHNHSIPKTTNSLEGHFTHLKMYCGVHRGVSRQQAQRILHSLVLASSVAPSANVLRKIL